MNIDPIDPHLLTPEDQAYVATLQKGAKAKSTSDWLEIYQEVVERSMYQALTTQNTGNAMEIIRSWRIDWKSTAADLKAIDVGILEDVELEDAPLVLGGRIQESPKGMKIHAPGRSPLLLRGAKALSAYNFFQWFISFKDTITGDPRSRRDPLAEYMQNLGVTFGGPESGFSKG